MLAAGEGVNCLIFFLLFFFFWGGGGGEGGIHFNFNEVLPGIKP